MVVYYGSYVLRMWGALVSFMIWYGMVAAAQSHAAMAVLSAMPLVASDSLTSTLEVTSAASAPVAFPPEAC